MATLGEMLARPFEMEEDDAAAIREVIEASRAHAAACSRAKAHFAAKSDAGDRHWVWVHAVIFGLTLDAPLVTKYEELLRLGGQAVEAKRP